MNNPQKYDPIVFYIADKNERDQCQFIHVPANGESPSRCQHDGIYRIGLTIFLCGLHTPGVTPHPQSNPIDIRKIEKPKRKSGETLPEHLLKYFQKNQGIVIPYSQIQADFPNLDNRQYISIIISRLRTDYETDIKNVPHVGYIYWGDSE